MFWCGFKFVVIFSASIGLVESGELATIPAVSSAIMRKVNVEVARSKITIITRCSAVRCIDCGGTLQRAPTLGTYRVATARRDAIFCCGIITMFPAGRTPVPPAHTINQNFIYLIHQRRTFIICEMEFNPIRPGGNSPYLCFFLIFRLVVRFEWFIRSRYWCCMENVAQNFSAEKWKINWRTFAKVWMSNFTVL